MSENFSASLSENILTLLVFNDTKIATLVSNIEVGHFENIYYKTIADKAIDFYKGFGESPKEHIADLLEKELNSESNGDIYKKILSNLYDNSNSINVDYVLNELERFIKVQTLKKSTKKVMELLQYGKVEEAEDVLSNSKKSLVTTFDPGIIFNVNNEEIFNSIDTFEEDLIYTGIETLDTLEHVPTKKELYTFVAPPSRGKSWFLIHIAKFALLQRKKILHVTLEMGEKRLIQRYFQSLFSLSSKISDLQEYNAVFETEKNGELYRINFSKVPKVKTLRDEGIIPYLKERMEKTLRPTTNLVIKEFPTGSLSINGLTRYLDNLETYHNFIPDIILVDYLDLMDIDPERLRIDLGRTCVELRGIAVTRNIPVVTVAQTNRTAEGQVLITRKNLAEDFSKVKTSDVLIIYNQTAEEKARGLARLYIDKGRNGRDGDVILISQNYSIGQFALSSVKINNSYWDVLNKKEATNV